MTVTLLEGDCIETLKTLPDCSVQCCITSPPYYGLRDYGTDGQIGLEETPDAYIEKLTAVFHETHRVLKNDGTLWLNLGDSYNGSGGPGSQYDTKASKSYKGDFKKFYNPNRNISNLKPKDLIGIPWAVAFALRTDGWWLRQDIVWYKPNAMCESVKDRCTKSHEYIFLLTKNAKYFINMTEIEELAAYDGRKDTVMKGSNKYKNGFILSQNPQTLSVRGHERWKFVDVKKFGKTGEKHSGYNNPNGSLRVKMQGLVAVRNKRDVWIINTKPYKGAHFATFPPELPRLCILAGSKPGDIVLDPFNGSGTTGEVAVSLGRNYIGCELNPQYIELTKQRLAQVQLVLNPSSIIT